MITYIKQTTQRFSFTIESDGVSFVPVLVIVLTVDGNSLSNPTIKSTQHNKKKIYIYLEGKITITIV